MARESKHTGEEHQAAGRRERHTSSRNAPATPSRSHPRTENTVEKVTSRFSESSLESPPSKSSPHKRPEKTLQPKPSSSSSASSSKSIPIGYVPSTPRGGSDASIPIGYKPSPLSKNQEQPPSRWSDDSSEPPSRGVSHRPRPSTPVNQISDAAKQRLWQSPDKTPRSKARDQEDALKRLNGEIPQQHQYAHLFSSPGSSSGNNFPDSPPRSKEEIERNRAEAMQRLNRGIPDGQSPVEPIDMEKLNNAVLETKLFQQKLKGADADAAREVVKAAAKAMETPKEEKKAGSSRTKKRDDPPPGKKLKGDGSGSKDKPKGTKK